MQQDVGRARAKMDKQEAQQQFQEVCARNVMRHHDSFYARSIFWKTASASNFFKKKPCRDETVAMGSTLDSWGIGTVGKLRNVLSPNVADETMPVHVITNAELLDVFQELDRKNLGIIETGLLVKAMRRCGLDVSKEAVVNILRDIGKDPASGISANDFVRFYRHAESLTKMVQSEKFAGRCTSYSSMICISICVVACCVFVMLWTKTDEAERRSVWTLAAIGTGVLATLFLCILLSTSLCQRSQLPKVEAASRKTDDYDTEPTYVQPFEDDERGRSPRTAEADFYQPESWRTVATDAPLVGDTTWADEMASSRAVVCQAPCQGARAVAHAQPLARYNPAAYTAAAAMGQARAVSKSASEVPGSFNVLSLVKPEATSLQYAHPHLREAGHAAGVPFARPGPAFVCARHSGSRIEPEYQ